MKKFWKPPFLVNEKVKKLILTMKLTVFILFLTLMQVSATVYSQATKFSFRAENKQVVEVLRQIEENSDFRFFFLREWHRFGYLPSGLAGWLGVAIVFVVGVVITASLNLVPKAGKALSWVAGILVVLILAGMTSAASLLLPVAFGAGFLVAGFLYGWIPGTIIGLVVGLIRSPRIETVDRTENQKED